MKRFIIIVLFSLFLFSSNIFSDSIGHSLIDRSTLDSAVNINFIDFNLVFSSSGKVTSWQIYGEKAGTLTFQIYRYISGNTYQLIGENTVTTSNIGLQTFNISSADQISFETGDFIGWHFWNSAGVINFSYEANNVGWNHDNTLDVGGTTTLSINQGRIYSIQANFSSVPEPKTYVLLIIVGVFFIKIININKN